MYIKDGIAYANEPHPSILVKSVRALDGYKLWVRFINDETKIFDFTPYLEHPCYQPLKDHAVFRHPYVDYGVVVWNDGEIDIAPERLYADGITDSNP